MLWSSCLESKLIIQSWTFIPHLDINFLLKNSTLSSLSFSIYEANKVKSWFIGFSNLSKIAFSGFDQSVGDKFHRNKRTQTLNIEKTSHVVLPLLTNLPEYSLCRLSLTYMYHLESPPDSQFPSHDTCMYIWNHWYQSQIMPFLLFASMIHFSFQYFHLKGFHINSGTWSTEQKMRRAFVNYNFPVTSGKSLCERSSYRIT